METVGISYGHLVNFTAIRYGFSPFGVFWVIWDFWHIFPKKNLAPLDPTHLVPHFRFRETHEDAARIVFGGGPQRRVHDVAGRNIDA
jgi:hypothetical protein